MANLLFADGTSFELAETETLVGRGGREFGDPPKVDVGPFPGGETVSRRHARISCRAGRWYFKAEPTARNPSLAAGEFVPPGEEVVLRDGQPVRMGDVACTFRDPAEVRAPVPDAEATIVETRTPPESAAAPAAVPIFSQVVAPPAPEPPVPEPPAQQPITPERVAQERVVPEPFVQEVAAADRRPAPVSWAARLNGRPATLSGLGVSELKRVNPFRGLMVDEQTWADDHEYHRLHDRLHLLSAHGWGIVEGLEVLADPQAPGTLVVRPGVAVDGQGRALLVAQERRLPVSPMAGTTLYVTLRLREELVAPQRQWSDVDEYTRIVERCECVVQRTPAEPPALELARLVAEGAPRNAVNPIDPRPGEIDLRFRERLLVRPRPELAIAQLAVAEGDGDAAESTHRQGLRFLLREIGLTSGYRPRWRGVLRPGDLLSAVSLLYLGGSGAFTLSGDAVGQLREFLSGGGVLFADGCREGESAAFATSVQSLAGQLGCKLGPVDRWHPVLTARHLFSEPPVPAGSRLVEGGGLILSTADFGCAWQGGSGDHPLTREAIRAALELGVNVAVYARQRQRPLEVLELEG